MARETFNVENNMFAVSRNVCGCASTVFAAGLLFGETNKAVVLYFALQKAIAPASCPVLLNEHPLLKYSTSRSVAKHPIGKTKVQT